MGKLTASTAAKKAIKALLKDIAFRACVSWLVAILALSNLNYVTFMKEPAENLTGVKPIDLQITMSIYQTPLGLKLALLEVANYPQDG